MTTVAITGGTGFVGSRTIERALGASYSVRALTRRDQQHRRGVIWVKGALDDPAALAELVTGADAVIHIAGVVNADRAGFVAGNIDGTRAILTAASAAGIARFVHVSSLAAREPGLSLYGWSKAEAERLVIASDRDWTILRPAAVYGPGDMEMRDLFRAAKLGLALLPPPGIMAAVAVDDLRRDTNRARGPERRIQRGVEFLRVEITVFEGSVPRILADHWFRGDDIDRTPGSVATIERSLRSFQHLDPVEVIEGAAGG